METLNVGHRIDTFNTRGLDIEQIRSDFPLLSQQVNSKPLIYFDSAATSHKPRVVIDRLEQFYTTEYGKPKETHSLSKTTTELMEESRSKLAKMINAASSKEIVFTKGCTEAINIVANGFADTILQKGDEIIITELEHHANIIPWIMACKRTGASLKVAPITSSGEVDLDQFESMINRSTRLISISHSSHVLGTILPVEQITKMAHAKDIPVLADGAQAAPHMPVDMAELDCDFYTFSGHKMGSPTGVGLLYGKAKWLKKISPLIGGGEMAEKVTFNDFQYADLPTKFEGGTTPFADIIGWGTLVDYVNKLDMKKTSAYEQDLLWYTTSKFQKIDRLKIYGNAPDKEPLISFEIEGMDVKKLEKYLNDHWGIAVRAGELTAQPLMKILKVEKLCRVSFCYYNTFHETDVLCEAIEAFINKHK